MATAAEIQAIMKIKAASLPKTVEAVEKKEKEVEQLEKDEKKLVALVKNKAPDAKEALKKTQAELKVEQGKLANLRKSREGFEEVIVQLSTRLKNVETFAKTREDYLPWWDKEEAKISTLVDKARDFASDAEDASKQAESAAKSGDTVGAQAAARTAAKAAQDSKAQSDAADKMVKGWVSTWDVQRNLKTSHMPAEDVKSYAALTRQVYNTFEAGQKLGDASERWSDAAAISAASAAEFAAAGGDLVGTYSKMLDAAAVSMQQAWTKIQAVPTMKWGGYIQNQGALFTKIRDDYLKNPEAMKAAAMKAVEQAGPFLESALNLIVKGVTALDRQREKVVARIGREHYSALKGKIDPLQKIVTDARKLQREFEANYSITLTKLKALEDAIKV